MFTRWCLSGKECAACHQIKGFTLRWQCVCVVFVMRTLTRTQPSHDHETTDQNHGYEMITFGFGDDIMTLFMLSKVIGKLCAHSDFSLVYSV